MLRHVQRLAVHRDQDLRAHPADHLLQLRAPRMAGDMHQVRPVGDDLDALADEPVDDPHDGLLVAGYGARGKDHAVTAREGHLGMLVGGDAGQRRARLALAAGAERDHLVGRQVAVGLDRPELVAIRRDSRSRARPGPPDPWRGRPRTTSRPQAAAASATARSRATFEAKVVTATRPGAVRMRSARDLGDVGFGRRAAFAHRIGGIADQREATFVAERAQLGFVGRRTDDRGAVDLPVAGMQNGAERGANDQAVRFRNRVGHRHELDVERPEREASAERNDIDRHLARARLALPLGLEQGRGERRRIDRQLEPRPQIEQRAEMVLMRVGEHEPEEIAPLLQQIADVRQDQIDAGQVVAGKRYAEVDRDPLPAPLVADPVDREIHADLADPAERREDEFVASVPCSAITSGSARRRRGRTRRRR